MSRSSEFTFTLRACGPVTILFRTNSSDSLGDALCCLTVLGIIGEQLLLEAWLVRCFPFGSPHQSMKPSGVSLGPAKAEVSCDVFQAVRVGWEIDLGVEWAEHVH